MIMQAKSGTGKTLAFAICLLESFNSSLLFPQSLVIVPTREIAVQIVGVLNELGKNVKHFKACDFIGGTEMINDRKKIQTCKVVVGTPGRVLHLIKNEVFNVSSLKTIVLDEADKLLESGQMSRDVKAILKMMHKKIQIIAATATVTSHLETIMKQTMKNPIGITPKHEIPVLLGIKQFVKVLPRENDNIQLMKAKIEELHKVFTRITFKQCLLFTDSQSKTESYGNYLNKQGWKNQVISAAQEQSQRLQVLDNLIKFKCRILITTDLMARGIDIENINLIINLDLPYDCFTYLHRIGRAGRFGSHGLAITFINGEDDVGKFQKMLGDIGGENLKALKYPDESIKYDFWDFKQNDVESLEAIVGVNDSFVEKKQNDDSENNKFEDHDCETIMNNLALLEITRKLVDDKSKKSKTFDLDAIIEDYERTLNEPEPKKLKADKLHSDQNGLEEENIFLKTIEDLKLYESEPEENEIVKPSESENTSQDASAEGMRHVIFKRLDKNEEEESSSSEDDDCDDEPGFLIEDIEEDCQENPAPVFNPYSQYVASNYSQWQNIYQFQLSGIQSYIESIRK